MKTLLKIDLSSVNGAVKKAQVELEQAEVDLIQQALACWCEEHREHINGPATQALFLQMRDLHKQVRELQMKLKGGE